MNDEVEELTSEETETIEEITDENEVESEESED